MLKILLWANTIFELAVGVIILIAPRLVFPDIATSGDGVELTFSLIRTIGITAIAIAALSGLMAMRKITPELKFAGIGALAVFQLGMTLIQLLNVIDGLVPVPVMVVHGVFAVLFLGIFIWNLNQ